ncbi:FG-GAP-like repeat-containing protein [Streptomyces wuyuanensis]|uniref:FG-GAP-like repeat-containing protein n=1 Tax=Streptomyces wuyuanensis TaxID=1196353 RepID=UPI003796523D
MPSPDRDLVMARLATPTTGIATLTLAASPPGDGDTLTAIGFGCTKTQWVPGTAHTASMKTGTLSDTELTLAGATANEALCKGDTGAPLLQESEDGVALAGIATRSRQGGCLGESETSTDATATRTDNAADWIATTAGRSWAPLMIATDFNGDKKADLLAIDAADDYLYAQPGDGKGRFGKPVKVSPGKWTGMRLLAAADFNGDKKGDLVAAHTNGNLFFYPGNGKNFASGTVSSTGWTHMRMLSAGDFTGDGKADIYAVHNSGDLYLYSGKGNGTFNTAKKTGAGWQNMRLLSEADFNGDQKSDLIAIHTNGNIHAYPGNDKGGFATPIVTPAPAI